MFMTDLSDKSVIYIFDNLLLRSLISNSLLLKKKLITVKVIMHNGNNTQSLWKTSEAGR